MSLSWLVLSNTWKRVTDGVSECDIFFSTFLNFCVAHSGANYFFVFPSFEKPSFKAHLI